MVRIFPTSFFIRVRHDSEKVFGLMDRSANGRLMVCSQARGSMLLLSEYGVRERCVLVKGVTGKINFSKRRIKRVK